MKLFFKVLRIQKYAFFVSAALSILADVIHKPKLLLLDEPYEALDIVNQDKISSILYNFSKEGCAVLVSSHIIEPLKDICNQYMLIENGRIERSISKSDIIKSGKSVLEIIKSELNINFNIQNNW